MISLLFYAYNYIHYSPYLISPEDNSLTSSQGDKGDEKMDTSTSGSDKDSGSPATAPVNDIKEVNNDVTTKNSGTKVSTSTSAYTTGQDTDTELAFSYQAETVDFPDSPRHMKLMAKLSAQELTADCLDDLSMNQDEDDVLRTVLSPGTDDSHSKKEDFSADSLKEDLSSTSEEYFEDNFILDNNTSQEESQVSGSFSSILLSTEYRTSSEIHADNAEENSKALIEVNDITLKKIRVCFDQEKIKDFYSLSASLQDSFSQEEIEEILNSSQDYSEFIDDDIFEVLDNARMDIPSSVGNTKENSAEKTNMNYENRRTLINANVNHVIDDDDNDDDIWTNDIKVIAVFDDYRPSMVQSKNPSVTNSSNCVYTHKILRSNLVAIFEESKNINDSHSSRKLIPAECNISDSSFEITSVPIHCSFECINDHIHLPKTIPPTLKCEAELKNENVNSEVENGHVANACDAINSYNHIQAGRPTCLKSDKKKIIKVNPDILNAAENDDEDAKSLSSLSNKSGDVLSPVDDMLTPVDIETPDELEDSILERLASVSDPIPEFSAAEEYDEERSWRTCVIAGVQRKIDMKVIEPYKKVLSHGGYCTDTHYAIIVFSACYLPDRSRRDYDYVMDNLFLYVLTTLDQLVADDYLLIYLHGATQRSNLPSFGWLKRCYQMIDRRLRKNLKGLYLVHPTFWLKTIVLMTKPFISSKFSRKLRFISCLKELAEQIPMDHLCIPEKVKQLEFELMIKEKKKRLKTSSQESNLQDDRVRFGL